MATLVGTQKELGSLLNNLIELDYDSVAAYEAAIARLHNQEYKERLREFLGDHQRHIIDLKPHAARLVDEVASGPDVKQVLTKGKVIIAKLAGDKAILFAMKTNEDDTNTAYERAVRHDAVTPEVLAVLQRNLADERGIAPGSSSPCARQRTSAWRRSWTRASRAASTSRARRCTEPVLQTPAMRARIAGTGGPVVKERSRPQNLQPTRERHGDVPEGSTQEREQNRQTLEQAPEHRRLKVNEGGRTHDSSGDDNPPGAVHGLPQPSLRGTGR